MPDFNENGYLPPGIHPATMAEIAARFGSENEVRRAEMQSLEWLIDFAREHRVQRIVINGSFVTDQFEPNDVDVVLLVRSDLEEVIPNHLKLVSVIPFLHVDMVKQAGFDLYVNKIYAIDRHWVSKGIVEIIQWT